MPAAASDGTCAAPEGASKSGSAGVGRATVRAFAAQGAHVGLLARGRDGLEGAGGRALVVPTDVAHADQVEAAAEAVERELGPIDVWVNNAMVSVFSPVKEMVLTFATTMLGRIDLPPWNLVIALAIAAGALLWLGLRLMGTMATT